VLNELEENRRKKNRQTLEDFVKQKKEQTPSNTSTNENMEEIRLNHEENPAPSSMSADVASLVRLEVQKAVSEIKAQIAHSNSNPHVKKKRNPIYIRDEDYPTFLLFRENNEPPKETLPKVIKAAGRCLELMRGEKAH
jgi:hypothetical protein